MAYCLYNVFFWNRVPVLLFIKQCLLVVNEIGGVLAQWMSISQLAMICVTVLHFAIDLDLGSVCLEFYTCVCVCVCVISWTELFV
jgi:hypothetical protein